MCIGPAWLYLVPDVVSLKEQPGFAERKGHAGPERYIRRIVLDGQGGPNLVTDTKPTIFLRTSERTAFKRCRQSWQWSYVDQIKPKVTQTPLRFGTLVHAALEARYPKGIRRGPHPARTFEKLYETELAEQIKNGFRDEDGEWHEAGQLGVAMLENFVDTFGADDEWDVIASELPFQVKLKETAKHRIVYVGTIDGVWRNRRTKKIWLNDWKTTKQITTSHLTIDEQAGAYWTFGSEFLRQTGVLGKNDDLRGVLFTFLRKAKPDPRPTDKYGRCLNKDGTISQKQPAPYFHREPTRRNAHESKMIRQRVLAEVGEMLQVRRGKLQAYVNPSQMNCSWCGYKDACELRQSGHDVEEFLMSTMQQWEPYSAHSIKDSGD